MKLTTKILIAAWALFAVGLTYMLTVPAGEASVWVLLPTALLSLPLVVHFGIVALQPLPAKSPPQRHQVIVDGVEYVPRVEASIPPTNRSEKEKEKIDMADKSMSAAQIDVLDEGFEKIIEAGLRKGKSHHEIAQMLSEVVVLTNNEGIESALLYLNAATEDWVGAGWRRS